MTETRSGARKSKDAKSTWSDFILAWQVRGGWRDIFTSLYFWIAAILLVPTAHFWLSERWWELPIGILPNVLGFSLGGYAIFLAFGDDKFKAILAHAKGSTASTPKSSLLLKVSSVFLHFIVVQLLALVASVLARAFDFDPEGPQILTTVLKPLSVAGALVGFFLFLYALMLAFAAAMSIFQLGKLLEIYLTDSPAKSCPRTCPPEAPAANPESGSGTPPSPGS